MFNSVKSNNALVLDLNADQHRLENSNFKYMPVKMEIFPFAQNNESVMSIVH